MHKFAIVTFLCSSLIFTGNSQTNNDLTPKDQINDKNAILNCIKFTSSQGDKPFELFISCKLIFTGKPSSYFYEVKLNKKNIILEFNDTKKNLKLDTSELQPPFLGYYLEENKINQNKHIKDTTPDWHYQTKVIFNFRVFPDIHVSDEFDSISFNYKWTSDTLKEKDYIAKSSKRLDGWLPMIFGLVVDLVVIGGIIWLATSHSK